MYIMHSHLLRVEKLEVADDVGGVQINEVGQLPHQEMKGLSNVSLADHLQQEGVMRCSPTESSLPPSGTAH